MTEDIDELRDRVSDLEDRVEALAAQVDETSQDSTQRRETGLDHYDEAALESLPTGQPFNLGAVRAAYQAAGVRDGSKIKSRMKHLTKTGVVEKVGLSAWRVVENE